MKKKIIDITESVLKNVLFSIAIGGVGFCILYILLNILCWSISCDQ